MEKQVFWKSVFRRTGSLLLLLALIVAASFGFVLRTVEYLSVNREMIRISENYRPIGTLASDSGDITEAASLLEESSYVNFVDKNRYCPAILKDIYNADLDGWSSNREDGMSRGVRINDILAWVEVEDIKNTLKPDVFRYDFKVKELVRGYPDYDDKKKKITVYFDTAVLQDENPVMEAGKTYLIKGYYPPSENGGSGNVLTFDLLPLEDNIWFLEGEPDISVVQRYLDADARLQEQNRHAMLAVTTADMSAMPLVQESAKDFYLEDGRWPDRNDSINKNMVCAVTKEFADVRGLKVGDTLTMALQNREVSYFGYITDADSKETCEETEVTLEIVGIYGRLYGGAVNNPGFVELSYNSNSIYIPDGCLPKNYVADENINQNSFSFVLTSPKSKDAFVSKTGSELETLGITCTFVENNWESYYASAAGIEQGAFYNFVVFLLVLVFALAVVAFLYTWQRKREIAIARSLGVPARAAAVGACFPILFFGAVGILAGGAAAWKYGQKQAVQTLAGLVSGGRAELNVLWLVGICFLQWLALAVVLLAGSFVYANRPVLETLQGNLVRANRRKGGEKGSVGAYAGSNVLEEAYGLPQNIEWKSAGILCQVHGRAGASVFPVMAQFLWRCIRRFSMRSISVLLVAVVFVTASGWLSLFIGSSEKKLDKLYDSVTVEAEIVKKNETMTVSNNSGAFIHHKTVQGMQDTDFVESVYLEAISECHAGKGNQPGTIEKTFVLGISDIEQFLEKDWNKEVQIQYGDEYGADLFQQECVAVDGFLEQIPAVIVSASVWEKWNLHPGSLFFLENSNADFAADCIAAGFYNGQPGGMPEDTMLVSLSFLELLEDDNLNYSTAKFSLDTAKNRELADFRDAARAVVEAPAAGELELSLVVWDNELRQVAEPMEKNINLMKVLYPVANIVSFFIAAGLGVLLLFQRRREAAILRVLGVGVMPVRLTLSFELLVLNVAGVLLGLAAIYVVTEAVSLPAMGIAAAAYFAGGVIGAIVGSVVVTKARPLELLQVKE